MPSQLGRLARLEELRVERNALTGPMPPGVCDLRASSLGALSLDCGGEDPAVACVCCTECA